MMKVSKLAVLAGMAAVWGCAMDASAQSGKALEDRLAMMKANGGALGGITAFYKENKGSMADVDKHLATLQANATKLASGAEALFPKGSSTTELGTKATGAKPEIWTKWDDFKKAAGTMDAEVKKLAAVVKGGDKAAIEAAVGNMGRVGCGTCHQPFRSKRDT